MAHPLIAELGRVASGATTRLRRVRHPPGAGDGLIGDIPQAFTHLALTSAAHSLDRALG